MAQASLLLLLLHEQKMTIGDITKDLGVSKGAVTQLLDSLLEKDLLEKFQQEATRLFPNAENQYIDYLDLLNGL